jgi:hypothetical protein
MNANGGESHWQGAHPGSQPGRHLPYLFALLGIEEQPSALQQMDAQIRRRRTFEALKRLFLRESLNQSLV